MSELDAIAAQKELEKALSSGVLLDDATTDALMARINGDADNKGSNKSSGKNKSERTEKGGEPANPNVPAGNTTPLDTKLLWGTAGSAILSLSSLILIIIMIANPPSSIPLSMEDSKTIKEAYLQAKESAKEAKKALAEVKEVGSQLNLIQGQISSLTPVANNSLATKTIEPEELGLQTVSDTTASHEKLKEISAQILHVKTRADELVGALEKVRANQSLIRDDIHVLEEELVLHRIPKQTEEKGRAQEQGSYQYRNPEDLYKNRSTENLYP